MLTNRLTGPGLPARTWGCYLHAAGPLLMLIISQSKKKHHCLVPARPELGVILSLARPASPRMEAWSRHGPPSPSSTPARPASLPPLVCPGCGNPIANLAHVIRRPVRLLSALPSFFSLRTLIETGTPRPRVCLLCLPRPRICAANPIAQLLASPRPTRQPPPITSLTAASAQN